MKKTNISIFIPHMGCPHKCSFCDQKSISGAEKAPRPSDISEILEQQAAHLEEKNITAQIAFFGGSFTAVPEDYMEALLKAARGAMKKFPVYTGIRCSTRPDRIDEKIIEKLTKYGVTAVELGAQSMSDDVLRLNERGHTAEDVRKASALIKSAGIELGLQMMTGLYGDTVEKSRETAQEFIKLSPETVRVYPTVILKNTALGELFERGVYKSFSFEETIELCAELLQKFEKNGIKVIRLGLHASAELEKQILGGVYHPALREIAESRIMLNDMKKMLSGREKGAYRIYTDKRNISKASGQKRANIMALSELGYDVEIKPLDGAYLDIR